MKKVKSGTFDKRGFFTHEHKPESVETSVHRSLFKNRTKVVETDQHMQTSDESMDLS